MSPLPPRPTPCEMHKLFSIKNQSRSAMAVSSTSDSDSAAPGYEIGYRTVSELAMIGPQTVCVSPISQRLSESTPFPPSLFLPHPRAHTHIASGRAGEGGEGGEGGKGGGGHGAGVCLTYPLPPSPHTRVWVSHASAWELAMSAVVDAASAAVAAGPTRRASPFCFREAG